MHLEPNSNFLIFDMNDTASITPIMFHTWNVVDFCGKWAIIKAMLCSSCDDNPLTESGYFNLAI